MLRQLQNRAEDLAESLLIAELEMRRSRTLEKRLEAYRDFGRVVDRIDVLRRDAEELHSEIDFLARLDRKAAAIMRTVAYRIAEWFHLDNDLQWYVTSNAVDPLRKLRLC